MISMDRFAESFGNVRRGTACRALYRLGHFNVGKDGLNSRTETKDEIKKYMDVKGFLYQQENTKKEPLKIIDASENDAINTYNVEA